MVRNHIPSWMVALLPRSARVPEPEVVAARLRESRLGVADARPVQPDAPDARWQLEVSLRAARGEADATMRVWLERTGPFPPDLLLERKHAKAARKSRWALSFATNFGKRPLADFHRQVRVVCVAAPDAVVVRDVGAGRTWPAARARDIARHSDPPCHHLLYETHVVFDACGNLWLHTHGLRRCGLIELEVMDARVGQAAALDSLLSVVTAHFLEDGVPAPGKPFEVQRGIDLAWLPPEKAFAHLPRRVFGSGPGRDEAHCVASGVLLVPLRRGRRRRYVSPALFVPAPESDEQYCAFGDHVERFPRRETPEA